MKTTVKIFLAVILIAAGLFSFFVVGKYAAEVETYEKTIQSIDDRKATVMGVSVSSATVAAAISAILGEMGESIANHILEVSAYLAIVVCFLVLEKSLLTILGAVASQILIPAAMAIFAISIFINTREKVIRFGAKILVLAVVLATVIPLSVRLGDQIYEVNRHTIDRAENFEFTMNEAETEENKAVDKEETLPKKQVATITEKKDNIFKKVWSKTTEVATEITDTVANGVDKVREQFVETTAAIKDRAKKMMNDFIDTVAVFLIAYCAIPILVVVFMLWFVKILFDLPISLPKIKRIRPNIGKYRQMIDENVCEDIMV